MAYGETLNPNRRAATLAAVTAIHLALGYALVTGLAGSIIPFVDKPMPTSEFPTAPRPSPTPETHPTVKPSDPTIDPMPQPTPIIDVVPTGDAFPPTSAPTYGTGGTGVDVVTFPSPTPKPSPSFATVGIKPLGNPGGWVTNDDYPTVDLRQEHEGLTRVVLTVGLGGKVENCIVTASSGFPGLDAAACAKLTQRARFKPGSDSTGAPAGGRYSTSVKWQIPKD